MDSTEPSPVSCFLGFAIGESPLLVLGWGRLKLFNLLGFRSPSRMEMAGCFLESAVLNLALVRSC